VRVAQHVGGDVRVSMLRVADQAVRVVDRSLAPQRLVRRPVHGLEQQLA
jgi:hypothetical protein